MPACSSPSTSPCAGSVITSLSGSSGASSITPARLSQVVQLAFSQRRKLLRHTLGRWLDTLPAATIPVFDLQRRAEEVPVAEEPAEAKTAE